MGCVSVNVSCCVARIDVRYLLYSTVKGIIWKRRIFKFCTCRSLCFDLFILVLSLFASSALSLAFPLFTRKHCLQFLGLRTRSGT